MSTLVDPGRALVRELLLRSVRRLDLLAGDRLVATLRAPGFKGTAEGSGLVSRYRARSATGAVLFEGETGTDMRVTGFVERGADVRLSELEVVIE